MEQINNQASPTKQAILDLMPALLKAGAKVDVNINDILDRLTESDYQSADKIFNSHQYPDHRIVYNRVKNIKACKAKYALNIYERMILDVLIDCMSVQNLVSISIDVLVDLTDLSNKTIVKSLKSLKEHGFIAIHTRGKKNCPTVYMINPALAEAGKPSSSKSNNFKELAGSEAIQLFECLEKNTLGGLKLSTITKAETFDKYNMIEHNVAETFISKLARHDDE